MPEYSSPITSDYIATNEYALASPVLCTAHLTLTMFGGGVIYLVSGRLITALLGYCQTPVQVHSS